MEHAHSTRGSDSQALEHWRGDYGASNLTRPSPSPQKRTTQPSGSSNISDPSKAAAGGFRDHGDATGQSTPAPLIARPEDLVATETRKNVTLLPAPQLTSKVTTRPEDGGDAEADVTVRKEFATVTQDVEVVAQDVHAADSVALQTSTTRAGRRIALPTARMDMSQSPTQSNHRNSYEQYRPSSDLPETSPAAYHAPASAHAGADRTLHDDDTGAVVFNAENFRALPGQYSQDLQLNDGEISQEPLTSQDQGFQQHVRFGQLPPQTPAVVKNPFGRNGKQDALLQGSQLFKQTQYSSALKKFSPTSSRPSPDIFQRNSISPNVVTSSPLRARRPPSPVPEGSEPSSSSQVIPSSLPIPLSSPQPTTMGARGGYEPVIVPQERMQGVPLSSAAYGDEDGSSGDDRAMRKREAKRRKLAAERQLEAVKVTRTPRSHQGRRSHRENDKSAAPARKSPERSAPQASQHPTPPLSFEGVIVDSQTAQDVATEAAASTVAQNEAAVLASSEEEVVDGVQQSSRRTRDDAIPETSPPKPTASMRAASSRTTVRVITPAGEDAGMLIERPADAGPSPPTSSIPQTRVARRRDEAGNLVSRSVLVTSSATESPPAELPSSPPGPPESSMSTLSDLATTPELSQRFVSPVSSSPSEVLGQDGQSAIESEATPKKADPDRKLRLETYAKGVRRSMRHDTMTPDGVGPSSSIPTGTEMSAIVSKTASPCRTKVSVVSRLFDGMAFAVSFRPRQPGETAAHFSARSSAAKEAECLIKSHGGRILSDGFNELIDMTSLLDESRREKKLVLKGEARNTGFTALIADGHSRKVKYVQALALGLPCLHVRWIETCIKAGKILDWLHYLLSAGDSAFLDGAVRSRSLLPYDASKARLDETIRSRPAFFHGQSVLVVYKRPQDKKAYLFLARVLGAVLTQVATRQEAKKSLQDTEYDWMYADGKASGVEDIIGKAKDTKKRRDASCPRILTDEVVIQSLIMGRIVEEHEWKA